MHQFFSVLLLIFIQLDQGALFLLEDSIFEEPCKVSSAAKGSGDYSRDNLLGILYLLLVYAKL